MADYYPLIARAVQGLSDPSPAMRGAVYDRARAALMDQLRSLDPPLSDEDIDREGAALDDAIMRVEADYAPPAAAPLPAAHAAPEPYPEEEPFDNEEPYADEERFAGPERYPEAEPQPAPQPRFEPYPEAEALPQPEPRLAAAGVALAKPSAAPGAAEGRELSPFTVPPSRRQPAYDDLVDSGSTVRLTNGRRSALREAQDASDSPDAPDTRAASGGERTGSDRTGRETTQPPGARARPRIDPKTERTGGGRARIAIIAGALAAVIGAIAATALSLRDDPVDLVAQAPTAAVESPAPVEDGKVVERIGGEPAPAAPPSGQAGGLASPTAPPPAVGGAQEGIAVAQRAVLYEEDPLNPQGQPRAGAGRAVWQLDPGGQGEPVVRATVEIPEPELRLVLLIRRNLDPTLPASHTIDLTFETGTLESRRVRDIGLLQLKDEETIRGAPVAGLPVPVRDNLFLIGLSNLPRDIERNTTLLTERNWIDLPIRLASGQRAILSFEKGTSGDRILDEAFATWEASGVQTSGN